MTYRGHIENGNIVLDEAVSLPEGAEVTIEVVSAPGVAPDHAHPAGARAAPPKSLYETLKPFIGIVKDAPPDSSVNLDHYLYGHPKR